MLYVSPSPQECPAAASLSPRHLLLVSAFATPSPLQIVDADSPFIHPNARFKKRAGYSLVREIGPCAEVYLRPPAAAAAAAAYTLTS